MIQLAYQPAYDPYHTAFRLLRLTMGKPTAAFKIDQLRILDFYLAFPSLVSDIEGLKRKVKTAGLDEIPPAYGELPSAGVIFRQMAPIQEAAIQTLCLQGIFDFDKEAFFTGSVSLLEARLSDQLLSSVFKKNQEEQNLMAFLLSVLFELPLDGPNGLKHRTGLMEHRYDYV